MAKKLMRSITVGFSVFLSAVIIYYTMYFLTYRRTIKATADSLNVGENISARESNEVAEGDVIVPDSYLARFDGKNIVVYAICNNTEEFLYTIRLRIADISENELAELKKGIMLPDKQALASFEEDFTS